MSCVCAFVHDIIDSKAIINSKALDDIEFTITAVYPLFCYRLRSEQQ